MSYSFFSGSRSCSLPEEHIRLSLQENLPIFCHRPSGTFAQFAFPQTQETEPDQRLLMEEGCGSPRCLALIVTPAQVQSWRTDPLPRVPRRLPSPSGTARARPASTHHAMFPQPESQPGASWSFQPFPKSVSQNTPGRWDGRDRGHATAHRPMNCPSGIPWGRTIRPVLFSREGSWASSTSPVRDFFTVTVRRPQFSRFYRHSILIKLQIVH